MDLLSMVRDATKRSVSFIWNFTSMGNWPKIVAAVYIQYDFSTDFSLVALQFREVVSTTFTLERSRDGGWVKMYEEEAARSAGGVEAHLQQTEYV